MRDRLSHPYVLLTLVALGWGANAAVGKLAVGHISPMLLTLMRWGFAALILSPFALPRIGKDWPVLRRHLPLLVGLGIIGFTGFNALFYLALNYTTAINVVIEQASMPLFVFILSFLLFRVAATRFQMLGFVLTLCGVAITAAHGDVSTLLHLDLNRGDAIMLSAVAVFGCFTVGIRYKPTVHWLSLMFFFSLVALVTSIPLAAIEWANDATIIPDGRGIAIALFTAVFVSILAQSLYIKAIEMVGANRANLFVNLAPVFGAGLAVVIVGEKLHTYHALALTLVLAGILIAERSSRRDAAAQKAALISSTSIK